MATLHERIGPNAENVSWRVLLSIVLSRFCKEKVQSAYIRDKSKENDYLKMAMQIKKMRRYLDKNICRSTSAAAWVTVGVHNPDGLVVEMSKVERLHCSCSCQTELTG
jgi:hypothetical protein